MTAGFTLEAAAAAAGARVERAGPFEERGSGPVHPTSFSGVFTDSRRPLPGGLFVALSGERHDGARFALQAARDGAAGLLVPRAGAGALAAQLDAAGLSAAVLVAVDTGRALLGLGRAWRARMESLRAVAITGSVGKTSTKELVAAVLATDGPTLRTDGNLNNEIGVPLTLLGLTPEHRYAAIECGMNHPGEIARLCAAVDPDVGVVTNVGPVHLEGCGSIEGVAFAKGELFHALRASATAVANADDPRVLEQGRLSARRLVTFGRDPKADVRLVGARHGGAGLEVQLLAGGEELGAELPLLGLHNGLNAAAAAAVGIALGLSSAAIRRGLSEARLPGRRMRPVALAGGRLLIDDCYNANPSSMRAALETVAALCAGRGRAVLVLGDMLELGPQEEELHRSIGPAAAALSPALLVCFGPRSAALGAGAIAAGLPPGAVLYTDDPAVAAQAVLDRARSGDVVLVKASRGTRLERVSDRLAGLPPEGGA